MYDYVDRPVRELDRHACLLVWSMRAWVTARASRQCPGGVLAGPFARSGNLFALQPFLRLMGTLDRHAMAPMAFHPLACPRVSEQEAILLGLVKAMSTAPATEVRDAVGLLVDDAAVGDALVALDGLASAIGLSVGPLPDAGAGPGDAWSRLPLWQ